MSSQPPLMDYLREKLSLIPTTKLQGYGRFLKLRAQVDPYNPKSYWLIGKYSRFNNLRRFINRQYSDKPKIRVLEQRAADEQIRIGYRIPGVPINRMWMNRLPIPKSLHDQRADPAPRTYMDPRTYIERDLLVNACHIFDDSLIKHLFREDPPDDLDYDNLPCYLGDWEINMRRDNDLVTKTRGAIIIKIKASNQRQRKAERAEAWKEAIDFAKGLYNSTTTVLVRNEVPLAQAAELIGIYAAQVAGIGDEVKRLLDAGTSDEVKRLLEEEELANLQRVARSLRELDHRW